MERQFFVYIATNHSRTLYIGVTNNLIRRMREHRTARVKGFTQAYKIDQLVYFEVGEDPEGAISREKQLKGWRRSRKIALIDAFNPSWEDLGELYKFY